MSGQDIDWSKSHNGVMLCSIEQTIKFMPETKEILNALIPFLQYHSDNYLVDVKVHMLMPGEYPCIPNWHQDFVPRDKNNKKVPSLKKPEDMMYLWVSGPPYTEFKTYQTKIFTQNRDSWRVFNQNDVHRGIKSEIFTWRCLIRLIPSWFLHPNVKNIGTIRRHTQVYIDNPENFRW